ncbi:hypothetical protein OFN54_36515, partial [Escherichia coli]|nr:hypothetical protein [Escherichia coli]
VTGKKLSTNSITNGKFANQSNHGSGCAFSKLNRRAVKNGITRPPITDNNNVNHHNIACHTAEEVNGGMPFIVA